MNHRVIEFQEPARFTVGTVGVPGERTFFIQAEDGARLISVSLEKSQVQALAERLTFMLKEIKQVLPTFTLSVLPRDENPLSSPIEEEFRVGLIGLAYDQSTGLIQIDLQAVSDEDDSQSEFVDVDDLSSDKDILRVSITPDEASRFSKRAISVVGAGRLPCPFCGGPIDSRGHLCPRANGYRR
ncbi:MAG: DUF3090 family protein [Actinobacteria bacterium]|uniref:Unannotated protein n=1 Tax=freshwater metagenome TaxID=449393 RepID=A0A6J5Z884_9ZZZZ|nr:DUF3090 family protein [Actinomycetota bacterium]